MTFKKKIFKNSFAQSILSFLTYIYILLVIYTSRIVIINSKNVENHWKNNNPFILAFWHSQLLMISYVWKSEKILNILASSHSDGRFGASVGKYLKLKNIPVFYKKKSFYLKEVFKILSNSGYIGITPDGPRGPNRKVSEGIIKIARKSKTAIIPIGFASSKNTELNSWDSFLITYPFSKCVFVWGNPIEIPIDLDHEELKKYQKIIETKINNCIKKAQNNLDA